MKFTELPVAGAFLIDAEPFTDERGTFRRHFCRDEFAKHGIDPNVGQGNISENPHAGTLRGFHFQLPPFGEAKTLHCISGSLFDIVVDLRPASATFMQWVSLEFSAADRRSLHVPAGCANAWLTTSPNTTVHYYMSEAYRPNADSGLRYNDPAFGFRWPQAPKLISKKDAGFPDFDPGLLTQA